VCHFYWSSPITFGTFFFLSFLSGYQLMVFFADTFPTFSFWQQQQLLFGISNDGQSTEAKKEKKSHLFFSKKELLLLPAAYYFAYYRETIETSDWV
jgi:hypothetical protein